MAPATLARRLRKPGEFTIAEALQLIDAVNTAPIWTDDGKRGRAIYSLELTLEPSRKGKGGGK
jgi:hypothetical protein